MLFKKESVAQLNQPKALINCIDLYRIKTIKTENI